MANTKLTDEWGSFTAVPNEFIANAVHLSDHARWMFVLLRFHTNSKTGTAFPSYDQIKAQTGWAYNTIAKAVKELEADGWLARKKQFSGTTHYTLIRRDQSLLMARNGENSQSLLMTSPCQSQGQSLPLASTVLAISKPNKTDSTKTEFTKTEGKKPPVNRLTISDALEEVFPGHATNIKTMNDLCALVLKMAASPEQVLAFPAWLSASYPMKALSPFSFKDQFPQFIRQNGAVNNGQNRTYKTAGERAAESTFKLAQQLTPASDNGADPAIPGFEWFDAVAGIGVRSVPAHLDEHTQGHPRQLTNGQF